MTHQNLKFVVFVFSSVFKVYVNLSLLHVFEIAVVFCKSAFEFVVSKGSDKGDCCLGISAFEFVVSTYIHFYLSRRLKFGSSEKLT